MLLIEVEKNRRRLGLDPCEFYRGWVSIRIMPNCVGFSETYVIFANKQR